MTTYKINDIVNDGPKIGRLGIGTWAMGGPFFSNEKWLLPAGTPIGWGPADDGASIRAIHSAIANGIKLIDTADAYGAGHAESVIGEALKGCRDSVFLATKFGNVIDENNKELIGIQYSDSYIRSACEASLRRLKTDCLDLYQLHISDLSVDDATAVAQTLTALREEGKIRYFGWSTDDPQRAGSFAGYPGAASAQFAMNVFKPAADMLDTCRRNGFAGLVRSPLAMGFLSGKYNAASVLPADDIRSRPQEAQPYFTEGGGIDPAWEARLASVREILMRGGRTMVQGALGWIWAQGELTVPIPGIRTQEQAEESIGALEFGALDDDSVAEIAALLGDEDAIGRPARK